MRIKELREARGIQAKTLAEACGVTPSAVCRWEANDAQPSAEKLPLVAATLGVEVGDLYDAKELRAASEAAVTRIREAARAAAAAVRKEETACRE